MKKIISFLFTITLSLVLLMGCSLFDIDKAVYYDQIVLRAGDYSFSKRELINAYNTYGYQYSEKAGSVEEGVKQTVTSLLERELLLDEINNLVDSNGKKLITLTEGDNAAIRKETFEYIQESIDKIEADVRKEWEIKVPTDLDKPTEKEPDKRVKKDYIPTVKFNYQTNKFERVLDKIKEESNIPMHFVQTITDAEVSREAMNRYIKSLQDTAKNENRDTDKNSVLLYEENRVISLLSKNKILSKFEYYYMSNLEIDTTSVLEKFKEEFNRQKTLYDTDKSAYHANLAGESRSFIFYNPNSGNEYMNVNHILIKLTEDEKADITNVINKNLEKKVEKAELKEIYNKIYRTVKINNKEVPMNALEILKYVNEHVTGVDLKERARQFESLVYIFNEDEGNLNSEFDYVVNLDTTVKDKMVKEFSDTSRALHKYGEGSISSNYCFDDAGDYVVDNSGDGDYVTTEYGLHIIFNAGSLKNVVNDANSITIEKLLNNYTKSTEEKSVFHYIYDSLAKDTEQYNKRTNEMLNNAKTKLANKNIKIEYFEKRYKDLWEK